MIVTDAMVEAAAREMRRLYEEDFDAESLIWQDFAGDAHAVLTAALSSGPLAEECS